MLTVRHLKKELYFLFSICSNIVTHLLKEMRTMRLQRHGEVQMYYKRVSVV